MTSNIRSDVTDTLYAEHIAHSSDVTDTLYVEHIAHSSDVTDTLYVEHIAHSSDVTDTLYVEHIAHKQVECVVGCKVTADCVYISTCWCSLRHLVVGTLAMLS